ncbi:MAG: YfcE family phosphodiesterase [Halobacteriaceae archaeon]
MNVVVLSDTHRSEGTGLDGRAAAAVADADVILHAGDFTTTAVLDAFHGLDARLSAVHGNRDTAGVRDRLPSARTVALGDVTVAMTHRKRGGETALALLGRERGADLVVSGHTHRPAVAGADPVLLNPGSHDAPRGGPRSHAELTVDDGLSGTIRTVDGEILREVDVPAPDESGE